MKFEKLILEKYGHYEGREISFRADADLHIVLGRNEAGKSTALKAMSDLLFGFDRRTSDGVFKPHFRFDMRDLRIGGQLRIANEDLLDFRRKRGNKNTLTDASGTPLPDDTLDAVLGGLDRDAFEKEYGLTSDSLRAGGYKLLEADGDLAETLAAGSAGLSALNRLKTQLASEANEMFATRKAEAKPFYKALDSYDKAKRGLHEAVVTKEAVGQAENLVADSIARQKQLATDRRALGRNLARYQRARNTRAKLQELDDIERKLAHIQAPPVAAPGMLAQWRQALAQEQSAQERIAGICGAIAENTAAIDGLCEQPALLECAREIEALRNDSAAADSHRKDIPRREQEHHAAWSGLERAAKSLGLEAAEKLMVDSPTRLQLADVRDIVQQSERRADRHARLLDDLKNAKQRRSDSERQAGHGGHVADPADLMRTFEAFANVPVDADALRRQAAAINQNLRDIENRLTRLSPPPPPLNELVGMALPDVSRIEEARAAQDDLARDMDVTAGQMGELTSQIDNAERDLKSLEKMRILVTHVDLTVARQKRDAAMRSLQDANASEREDKLAGVGEANRMLDRITDDLLANADDAARKLALEQELARWRGELERLRQERNRLREAQAAAQKAWRALWTGLDIEPDKPAAMANWLARVGDAIAGHDALSADRKDMEALRSKLQAQVAPLQAFLKRIGHEPLDKASVEQLHAEAARALAALKDRWTQRLLQVQMIETAAQQISTIEADIASLASAGEAEAGKWNKAMAALRCGNDAGIAEADEALRIWDEALVDLAKFRSEESRLKGIQSRIAEFEAKVWALCEQIAPDLAGGDAFGAVEHLALRLKAAEDVSRTIQGHRHQEHQLRQQLDEYDKKTAAARAQIAAAVAALTLADADSLIPALDRIEEHQELLHAATKARDDLAGIAGGISAEDLRAEQVGIDFDTLDGDIANLEDRAEDIRNDEQVAYGALRDAERALEALLEGRNAAALAQEREQAAGELLDISRRWLVRAAAARLAGQAIERHRRQAQGPAMARASALFAHATAGAFERLAPDYDDNDKLVFKAIRMGGEPVDVSGLSDGTRDQLFLALRLAMLEQRRGEPLPFIGDDLLTSFDETRTAQAIDILAEFGKERQAILFSHHRHVAEIARDKLGSKLDLIEL